MRTIVMNMVRIFRGNEVLVLDKIKKFGWEGLTFPGGKVEDYETFENSAIREAKEETNLDVKGLKYHGQIIWYDYDSEERYIGYLYTATKVSGQLIESSNEGNLFYMDYREFMKMNGKSDSMDDILKIYEEEFDEIYLFYKEGKIYDRKCIKYE